MGRFVGETALAGVSVAYPLSQISVGFGSLIGIGAGAVLRITNTQNKLLGNVNLLSLACNGAVYCAGLMFSAQMMKIMGADGDSLILGNRYFRITILGSLFWVYGLARNMIVRAEG